MPQDETNSEYQPTAVVENPQQYRLIDLFALMTLVAMVSAMAAPFLREMQPEYRNHLMLIIACQVCLVIASLVYFARKRQKLLKQSGSKIGSAFCGQFSWQYWPVVKSILGILIAGYVQVTIALYLTNYYIEHGVVWGPVSRMIDKLPFSHRTLNILNIFSVLDYVLYLQYSFFLGYAISVFNWRAYPNSIEFFQHGITQRGTVFIPWEQLDIRSSSVHSDKLTVVIRSSPQSIVGTTLSVQASKELQKHVLTMAETT